MTTCSASSRQLNEPLHATIAKVRVWFLLEYNSPWGNQAIPQSTIPKKVKIHLESVSDSKTLLIRQPGRSKAILRFYVIVANADNPTIRQYDLADYLDLLDLDLETIISESTSSTSQVDELYIVCTNSQRDTCCGQLGVPFYREMSNLVGESVWQCSHIGGHRFAATMLCFPHGIAYGRLDTGQASDVIHSYQNREILLPHYRGWSIYEKLAQAGDALLREQLGMTAINALQFRGIKPVDEQTWDVFFAQPDSTEHTIRIQQSESQFAVIKSCRDDETTHVPQFMSV